MARIGARARPDGRVINPAGLAPDWDCGFRCSAVIGQQGAYRPLPPLTGP